MDREKQDEKGPGPGEPQANDFGPWFKTDFSEGVHETYTHALSASLPFLDSMRDRIFGTDSQAASERANLDEQIAFVRRVMLVDGPAVIERAARRLDETMRRSRNNRRDVFAAACLTGMLANPGSDVNAFHLIYLAFEFADRVLELEGDR